MVPRVHFFEAILRSRPSFIMEFMKLRKCTAAALLLIGVTWVAPVSQAKVKELPAPCTGSDDWLQLDSAEWLRGNLRRMRNRTIEFNSEDLNSQTFDWEDDVATLCMAGIARFVRADHEMIQGIGHVDQETVSILSATGQVEFPRSDLVAILPGRASELDRWSFKLSLGGDFNTGNTNQSSLNASVVVSREDSLTRSQLAYYGSYGAADGVVNVNRYRVEAGVDYFLTKRFYAQPFDAALQYDEFQNIEARVSPTAGFGYRVIEKSWLEWDLEAAMGYQYLRNISVVPGLPIYRNDFIGRLTTYFKWTIVNDLKLTVNHTSLIVATDIGRTSGNTRSVLSYKVNDLIDIETTFVHDRVWEPVPNAAGVTPKKDDFQLIFSLAVNVW